MGTFVRFGSLLGSLVAALVVSSFIDASAAPATCANVRCRAGTHCVDMPTGPKCVPNLTCANIKCIGGTHCVETPAGPRCLPNPTCANVRCRAGTHCVNTPTGPKCVGGPPPQQQKY